MKKKGEIEGSNKTMKGISSFKSLGILSFFFTCIINLAIALKLKVLEPRKCGTFSLALKLPMKIPSLQENYNPLNEIYQPLKNKIVKKHTTILALFALAVFFSSIAIAAIPDTINVQGKLTDASGNALQGTYNFTFKIYDAATSGNVLWNISNRTIATDSNGIYDVILAAVNLSFSDQYYLGVAVASDQEMTPRINLTSSPYSFRANISDSVKDESITNESILSSDDFSFNDIFLSQKITFALGEVIDNIVSGLVKITGNLLVTGKINASDWSNVSITESQVTDLSHTIWTNTNSTALLDNNTIIRNNNQSWFDNFFNIIYASVGYKKENLTTDYPNLDTDSTDDWNFANNLSPILDNNTIIRTGNITGWDRSESDDFNFADNMSTLLDNSTINRSIDLSSYIETGTYPNADTDSTDDWNFVNNASAILNNVTLIRTGNTSWWANLYDTRTGRFSYTNLSTIGNNDINTSGSLNISGNVTFTQLLSCDTIDTDANGLLTCGSDSVADSSAWDFANNDSAVLDNGTIIRTGNITGWDRSESDDFNFADNMSALLDNSTINRSVDLTPYNHSIDLSSYLTTEFTPNSTAFNRSGTAIITANVGDLLNHSGNVALNQTLFITDDGKVGIGTSTPSHTLNVVGSGNFTQNLTVDATTFHIDSISNRVGIGTGTPSEILHIYKSGANVLIQDSGDAFANLILKGERGSGSLHGTISFENKDTQTYTSARIGSRDDGDAQDGNLEFFTNSNGAPSAEGNLVERMRITSDGRVGIGTGTPGMMLDVRGKTRVKTTDSGNMLDIEASNTNTANTLTGLNFVVTRTGTGDLADTTGIKAQIDLRNVGADSGDVQPFLTTVSFQEGTSGTNTYTRDMALFIGRYRAFQTRDWVMNGIMSGARFSGIDSDSGSKLTFADYRGVWVKDHTAGTITKNTGIWIDALTRGTTDYGIVLDGDSAGSDIVFGADQDAKIYWDGTNLIFDTVKTGSPTSNTSAIAWFSSAVSATNFTTRTTAYDTKIYGSALSRIKNSSQLIENGKLKHRNFDDFERVTYKVTDYGNCWDVIDSIEYCYFEDKKDSNSEICISDINDLPKGIKYSSKAKKHKECGTKDETGVDLGRQIAKHEQALFELNQEVKELENNKGSQKQISSIAAESSNLEINGTFSVINESGTQGLHQDSKGNVGIGTASPKEKLDINGNVKVTQTVFASTYNSTQNNVTITSAGGSVIIRLG